MKLFSEKKDITPSSNHKNFYRPFLGRICAKALFVAISLLILSNCVDRPRDNPLDPQNPKTNGRPIGFKLASREQQIFLSWEGLDIKDLDGMNIYRKKQGDSIFAKLEASPVSGREFIDTDVEYGNELTYRITAKVGEYESPSSEEKSIIPGPTYTWIADSYVGQVIRFCHDMRYELFRIGFIAFPTAIAASASERAAWVLDRYASRLYKISEFGDIEAFVRDLNGPTALAVNQQTGDLWVAQRYDNTVSHLDAQGNLQRSFAAFEEPVSVDIHDSNGECWVADRKAKKVFRISAFGLRVTQVEKAFLSPLDIDVDPKHSVVWIADSTRVLRYEYGGYGNWSEIDGFFWAQLLAADEKTGECWIVDLQELGKPAKLLKVDATGNIVFELSEFGHPQDISVNYFNGSCLVADSGYQQLVKVSSDGKILSVIENVKVPQDVAVENH